MTIAVRTAIGCAVVLLDLSRTGEPIHRVERLHLMLDWFDRYTRR